MNVRKSRSHRPKTPLTPTLTSQHRGVRKSRRPLQIQAQSLLVGLLSGRTVKDWRHEKGLSAASLGKMMGYSRSYVKAIEGGSLPVSRQFAEKFRELRENKQAMEPEPPKPITVISHYTLPQSIEILAKPIKCRGCYKWILPRSPNQKTHATKACRRKARRIARLPTRKRRTRR